MHKIPIKIRSVTVTGLGEADQAFLSYSGGVIPLVKVLDRILAIAALVRYLSFRSNLFGSYLKYINIVLISILLWENELHLAKDHYCDDCNAKRVLRS